MDLCGCARSGLPGIMGVPTSGLPPSRPSQHPGRRSGHRRSKNGPRICATCRCGNRPPNRAPRSVRSSACPTADQTTVVTSSTWLCPPHAVSAKVKPIRTAAWNRPLTAQQRRHCPVSHARRRGGGRRFLKRARAACGVEFGTAFGQRHHWLSNGPACRSPEYCEILAHRAADGGRQQRLETAISQCAASAVAGRKV